MSDLDPMEGQAGAPVPDALDSGPAGGDAHVEAVQPSPPRRKKRSIFADPVVRVMAFIAAGMMVLYLVTILAGVLMGVVGTGEPRSRNERELQVAERAVTQTPDDVVAWRTYIAALIADGQYGKAQDLINQTSEQLDQGATQDILATQIDLYFKQKEYEAAIKGADELRSKLEAHFEAAKEDPDSPESKGEQLNRNYYDVLIIKAESLAALGDVPKAIETLDEYLKERRTAADVLVRRGELKAEQGDAKGAEADFRAALVYIPDDKTALEGLKEIGAEQ